MSNEKKSKFLLSFCRQLKDESDSSDDFIPGSLKSFKSKKSQIQSSLKDTDLGLKHTNSQAQHSQKENEMPINTTCSQSLEEFHLPPQDSSTVAETPSVTMNRFLKVRCNEQPTTSEAASSDFGPKRDHSGQIVRPRIQLDKYSVSKSASVILPQVAKGVNFSFSNNLTSNSVTCVVTIDKRVITAKQGQTEAEAREKAAEDALRLILINKLYSKEVGSIPWGSYGDFAKYKMLNDWGLVGVLKKLDTLGVSGQKVKRTARKSFPRKPSLNMQSFTKVEEKSIKGSPEEIDKARKVVEEDK